MAGATNTVRIDVQLITKEAQAQVKLLNDELSKIGKGMDNKAPDIINRTGESLKSSSIAYQNYAKAQELSGLKTSANVTRLQGLKTAMSQNEVAINAQKRSIEQLSKAYGDNDARVSEAKSKLVEMESAQSLSGAKVAQLSKQYGNLTPHMAHVIDKHEILSQKMNKLGSSMASMGTSATLKMSVPIMGAFGMAVRAATQYQYELQDVRKEVQAQGYSTQQVNSIMNKLSKDTLDWSKKFGVSTTEINKGMFEMVSNGYNVKQSMGMMPMLLKTMTANSDQSGKSIQLTSSILEQFGQNIGSNSKVIKNGNAIMNQMTEATHKSAMSLDDLQTISGNAGAAMHAMGVKTNEFLALAGRLKSAGIDASSVGTGLSSMMTRLGTGTGQAAEDLKKYNIQIYDSKGKMKDVFDILGQMQKAYKGMNDQERQKFMYDTIGQENMKVGMTLMDANLGRYKSLSNEIEHSNGTVDKYNKTMQKTNKFTQDQFMASLKSLEIEFGQGLIPALTPILRMFTSWIDNFSKLNGNTQQFIVKLGLFVAALGPIMVIGGNIIKMIGSVHSGISKIEEFFGRSVVLSKIESENAAYTQQIGLLKEINNQKNIEADATGNVVNSGKGQAQPKANPGMSTTGKILTAAGAIDAASSFWGALQAQSKASQNQAIWEGGGKTVGMAAGAVLGGPEGALIGEQIGGAITSHIKIEPIVKKLQNSPKPKQPTTSQAPVMGMGYVPVAQKEATKFKSIWKDAFNSISGLSNSSLKSYENFQSTVDRKIDSETKKNKANGKAALRDLLNSGRISQREYNADVAKLNSGQNSLSSRAKRDTAAVVKARNDLNNKLKGINEKYKRLESGKSPAEVKKLEDEKQREIIKAKLKGNKDIKGAENKLSEDLAQIESGSKKKQLSIQNQLKDSSEHISNERAASLIHKSYEIEQNEIASANRTYDKAIAAAKKKKDDAYAVANQEVDGKKVLSDKESKAIKDAADKQYSDATSSAEAKKNAAIDKAKSEHEQVVSEAKKQTKGLSDQYDTNTGDAKKWWSGLKDWFANNQIIAKVVQTLTGDGKSGKSHKSHALGGAITYNHTALVGEEGPELAYDKKKGKARMLGAYGPEVTKVYAGETILTASQTKKALHGQSAQSFKSYAGGTGASSAGAGPIAGMDTKVGGAKNNKTTNLKFDAQLSDENIKKNSKKIIKEIEEMASKVAKQVNGMSTSVDKKIKDMSLSVDKQVNNMSNFVDKQINDMTNTSANIISKFSDYNDKVWKSITDDTTNNVNTINKNGTNAINQMSNNISNIDNNTARFWHRDWQNMANDFNAQLNAIIGYARNNMNGAIGQLNHGIGNINGLVAKFGGNSAILPTIPTYATGSKGPIKNDEVALVNDGHGPSFQELIQRKNGTFQMLRGKNQLVDLHAGDKVYNGQQTNRLINSGLVVPHAEGTVDDDDALLKMVSDKQEHADTAWKSDFDDKVVTDISPAVARSMALSARNAIDKQGIPWYAALWNEIGDLIGAGSGSRGAFLKYAIENFMGKPYLMGGNGPEYYDCSGMVAAALAHFGINIGRTTTQMQTTTDKISMDQVKPGDLTIWGHGDGADGHVGILMNRQGKMFNETVPKADYGNVSDVTSIPWDGAFRIRQLHDEDTTNKFGVTDKLKALVKSELGDKATSWIQSHFQPPAGVNGAPGGQYNSAVGPTPTGGHNGWMAQAGIPANERAGYNSIIVPESGWNVHATNPSSGAYGLPQSLPGSKMASAGSDWRDNPVTQLRWMKGYINGRYGSIGNALAFRASHGWYANGGWGQDGQMNIFNEVPGEQELVINPHRKSAIRWIKEAISAVWKHQPNEARKAFAPVELPDDMKNVDQNYSLPTSIAMATPEQSVDYSVPTVSQSSSNSDNSNLIAGLLSKITGKGMQINVNVDSQSIITKNIPLINALLGNDSLNLDLRSGLR